MPDPDADQLSEVFAALADPTRRDIVARLAVGDASVNQLAAPYAMSLQAVSKHLKVLEEAGLVSSSQDGQRRPRHLEADVLDLMTVWVERYRRTAQERFERLDALLARPEAEPEHPFEDDPPAGGAHEHHHPPRDHDRRVPGRADHHRGP